MVNIAAFDKEKLKATETIVKDRLPSQADIEADK